MTASGDERLIKSYERHASAERCTNIVAKTRACCKDTYQMPGDINLFFQSLAAAQQAVRIRLTVALCLSLLAHAGLVSLPLGRMSQSFSQYVSPNNRQSSHLSGQAPAPLVVSLAPFRLTPAESDRPPRAWPYHSTHLPRKTSPTVADQGHGDGGFAETTRDLPTAPASTPGMPLPKYFDSMEVTSRATALDEIDFDLPEMGQIGGSGKAVLMLYINETGLIDKVDVEAPGEINPDLIDAVARQFGRAVFQPATIDNVAVKSRMRVEIILRPLMNR